MGRGLFIVIEGVDGSGKSTLVSSLVDRLSKTGFAIKLTREPGGSSIGPQVRELLLSHKNSGLTPESELFLFSADRRQHVQEVIRPGLEAGDLILCSRYIYSTLAYQGFARGIDRNAIDQMNSIAIDGLLPDLVLLLDLDPRQVQSRLQSRLSDGEEVDRIEKEAIEFHDRVRHGFLTLAEEDPKRFCIIDASAPKEVVAEKAFGAIQKISTQQ